MKRSSSPRRSWWLLLLLLLAASTPAAGLLFNYSSRAALNNPQSSVRNAQSDERVVCFGQVDLLNGVTALYPLQPGRVRDVLVQEGQTVSEGAVLLRLEDGPARSRLAEAQAAVEEAKLRLDQAHKLPQQHVNRIAQ
jgi:multidrug efflux pump subunit AcrA (membrane-fusion protein)